MKQILLLSALFFAISSFSQNTGDVTIFSNTGDQFYVVLNGIRQNNAPETNVKVTGLNNNWYSAKIISANNNFTIDKNIVVKYDTLITYQIISKKGKYKMRFLSETPMGSSTAQADQSIITYHATETAEPTNTVNTSDSNVNTNTTVTTTTTTTSSTTNGMNTSTTVNDGSNGSTETVNTYVNMGGNGMGTTTTINDGSTGTNETVNMNVSVTENGMNVNINASGTESGNMNTSTSTSGMNTTTTTSTSSSSDGSYYEETTTTTSTSGDGTTYYEETTTVTTSTSTTTTGQGDKVLYEDNDMTATFTDCSFTDVDAENLAKQIKEEAFSDDQQRIANLAAENKCMSTSQIKTVAESFTFSENQLSFMKAAYNNCTDKSNYYQLMNILTFSDDKEELEKFINSK